MRYDIQRVKQIQGELHSSLSVFADLTMNNVCDVQYAVIDAALHALEHAIDNVTPNDLVDDLMEVSAGIDGIDPNAVGDKGETLVGYDATNREFPYIAIIGGEKHNIIKSYAQALFGLDKS